MTPGKLRSTSKQKGAPLQSRKIPANTQASAARQVSKSSSLQQMQKDTCRKKAPKTEASKNEQDEESIQVAIRMRPLNAKEANANRIWRVMPQYNSVTRTTSTGQPLPEQVNQRTFFTFDKTFGEDASNVDVYDNMAKGIVESAVEGNWSIEEGYSSGGGGIVHMAAHDIFAHVKNTPDRIFLIRASFIEIYNEKVRDLLGDNPVLAIREDPRRGFFVNATDEIVTDFENLLRVLFSGEKNRAVTATGMNERSSRSHTIFRIKIESRQKGEDYSENDISSSNSSLPSDDGAVRISSLNLVDLAGSESVQHTGSAGYRQKMEGRYINQSLLALDQVIVGLGQPNQTHIKFRGSKLTRILQPSLSGNARMAVISCATPSEFYLENTLSTLLFASRAKLVKTKAQVNEVLDDKSLLKRLERKLAETIPASAGPGQLQHLKALEAEALNAGTAARDAEKKLDKLKSSILNHAVVFGAPPTVSDGNASNSDQSMIPVFDTKKRRWSDGAIMIDRAVLQTPSRVTTTQRLSGPCSVSHEQKKPNRAKVKGPLSPSSELAIVQEAFNAKVEQVKRLKQRLAGMERKESQLAESFLQASQMICEVESNKNAAILHENPATAKDAAMKELSERLKSEQSSKTALEEYLSAGAKEIEQLKQDPCAHKQETCGTDDGFSDDDRSSIGKWNSSMSSSLNESCVDEDSMYSGDDASDDDSSTAGTNGASSDEERSTSSHYNNHANVQNCNMDTTFNQENDEDSIYSGDDASDDDSSTAGTNGASSDEERSTSSQYNNHANVQNCNMDTTFNRENGSAQNNNSDDFSMSEFSASNDSKDETCASEETGKPTARDGGQKKVEAIKNRKGKQQRKNEQNWDKMFKRLIEYKKQHGHCDVPRHYEEDPNLGNWVHNERALKKAIREQKRQSKPEYESRFQKLEKLGFNWELLKRDRSWDDSFELLVYYKKQNGNCDVPRHYENDPPHGNWVNHQRKLWKAIQKKKRQSKPEYESRFQKLEKLGFNWEPGKRGRSWDDSLELLVNYKKQNGNCDVPRRYENDPPLGNWVNHQRKLWKAIREQKRQSKPEYESRFQKLEKLGFNWEPGKRGRSWDDSLELLVNYKKQNGNCDVPRRYENDPPLGNWVNNQRVLKKAIQKKKRQSKPEYESRFQKLEKLGFNWEPGKTRSL